MNTKEIEVYKKDIEKAGKYCSSVIIKTDEDYKEALNEAKSVKVIVDKITARKEEMTKPLNLSLKSIRDFFRPIETKGEEAIKIIKSKMLTYSEEKDRKAEEARLKIAARVERGTMKDETAINKMNEIQGADKTVKTDNGKATVTNRTAYRVINKKLIPLEFMEPNMVAIKASFKAGNPIAGVEEYIEKNINLG